MTAIEQKPEVTALARPWLKSYPDGVPHDIGPLQHRSVAALFENSCSDNRDKAGFTCMGRTMTFGEVEEQSLKVAAWLQSKGVVKGDRVGIMLPNILQFPVVTMAALRAGCIVVNINPLYTPRELHHQLADSGVTVLFALENFASTVQASLQETSVRHVVIATMGDLLGLKGHLVNFVVRKVKKLVPAWSLPEHTGFKALLSAGASLPFTAVSIEPSDIAFLQYTGGTTGVAKGAMLTNANVLSNAAQTAAWLKTAFDLKGHPADLTFVCPLPLYHIFALTVNMVMGMTEGARNLLIPNPRDIRGFIKELKKTRFHVFPGLNTLFNALANNPDFAAVDFRGLMLTLSGGMACQRSVAERWQSITKCVISEGYGLSETSPIATVNRLDAAGFTGFIGLPLPSTEIDIRDDDGNSLALGVVGEICIRGPQVMAGYWNRPDETAKVMTADGYFRSGDMGFMDADGYTKIVDRKKDMIIVSGFNVYPNEVEEVVASHPGVLEVAAIGVPDDVTGEAVKLYIVKRDASLTADAVKAFCASSLTNYKRPKFIEFRDSLPKSNVGKILRKELRG
ncbi:long-chain-fatty-acid--CoA ligase [Rhizobium sp. KVB221]|uniref:Long-chain-fatty-acid--CoA ligase n=1 Tax=Rhizobium setariae TaxID=2801340 RepID=A0A936YHL8_9HYPH|nr:long-chain-fatty-acid--CoA ligase [Rhizobium setariae]MBL0370409.1 long-chain-fatty-acid--CoA ligase [Rhizobium setariae]